MPVAESEAPVVVPWDSEAPRLGADQKLVASLFLVAMPGASNSVLAPHFRISYDFTHEL